VIALYQDFMIGSLEVVAPLFHSLNDRQKLPIVHIIILFGRRAFSIVEIDWSESPEFIVLVENTGNREATCISLQNPRLCRVEIL
jgi:hypothetical protein